MTKLGDWPVAAAVCEVSPPLESIVNSEMVPARPKLELSTASREPVGSIAIPVGPTPVAAGVPVRGVVAGTPEVNAKP